MSGNTPMVGFTSPLASARNWPKALLGPLIAAVCTLTAPLSEELRHAVEIDDASRTAALLDGRSGRFSLLWLSDDEGSLLHLAALDGSGDLVRSLLRAKFGRRRNY